MVTAMAPSSARVVAAFLLFGFLNAGTPLLMASTPVSAAQPEENARRIRNPIAKVAVPLLKGLSGAMSRPALAASGRLPNSNRPKPHAAIPRMVIMKTYVGTANAVPDSRTPRRFIVVRNSTAMTATKAWLPARAGIAEAAYWAAEEMETATVST